MDQLFYENYDLNDLPGEVWGDYDLIAGKYKASNLGRVKIMPNPKIGRHNERILKQSPNPDGYLQVQLWLDGIRKTVSIHRMIALSHIANPENKPEINHKWGVKVDNRASELEWATRQENIVHTYTVLGNTCNVAEKNSRAKLSNAQVLKIYRSTKPKKEISLEYGVPRAIIQNIKTGYTWASVTGHLYKKTRYLGYVSKKSKIKVT